MGNQHRTRSRRDESQLGIEQALKKYGFSVASTHEVGSGFPDMLVGVYGLNFLVEIKNSIKLKPNDVEIKFSREWKGQTRVAHSHKEVVSAMKAYALWLSKQLPAVVEECERVLRLIEEEELDGSLEI